MDLFGDATRLRTLVMVPVAQAFDHPYVRSLIVVRRMPQGAPSYLVVDPSPHIKRVSAQLIAVYGQASVKVELEDEQVTGISKAYSKENLLGSGVNYVLDGWLAEDGLSVEGGYLADRVQGTILSEQRNTWGLVLRRRKP